MFVKEVLVFACVATLAVGDLCTLCPIITQKQVFDNADVVAKVKIDKRTVGSDWVTYDVTYETIYKPKNLKTDNRQIISSPTVTKCGVPNLLVGQEYLISAKVNGNKLEITTCGSFPPRPVGRPVSGPPLWTSVDSRLAKKLDDGKFIV